MDSLCIRCKGKGLCKKPCKILSKFIDNSPRVKLHFSGNTPPEIFVGRVNYPNIFSGILAPSEKSDSEILSYPELWVKNNLSIEQILENRGKLIYARKNSNIKQNKSLVQVMQQVALASKPVSSEFFLEKPPTIEFSPSRIFSIMTNPAPVKKIIIEDNIKVPTKVDYLVSDYDVKATEALKELYKTNLMTSYLQKLLSGGLLGVKINRKLVPTRWAITAVDDILSKFLLEKIKTYPEIKELSLFSSNYNGNHYLFLLLPGNFEFEVIEVDLGIWNPEKTLTFMQDYESFFSRKTYASNVTGAYYANRLGVCEYLSKIKKQASVLILREVREDYYAPLGVGILREITRKAFQSQPETFQTLEQAYESMQLKFKLNIMEFIKRSNLIANHKKQTKISHFL